MKFYSLVLVLSLMFSTLAFCFEAPSSFDSKIKSISATEESLTATFESLDETGAPRTIKIVANNFKEYNRVNLLSIPVLIAAYQANSVLHVDYKADINMGRIVGYYPVITLKK